jgi:hypothetical protein
MLSFLAWFLWRLLYFFLSYVSANPPSNSDLQTHQKPTESSDSSLQKALAHKPYLLMGSHHFLLLSMRVLLRYIVNIEVLDDPESNILYSSFGDYSVDSDQSAGTGYAKEARES